MKYEINDSNRGRRLASGYGIGSMMEACHENEWSDNNTILVVEDTNDFDSKWEIYEPKH